MKRTEQPLLPQNYTPSVIAKLKKEWTSKELASALDMRVRQIEDIGDLTFLESGVIILEFERNEQLWQELGYAKFTAWMDSGRVKGSRSKRYAALAAVKAMIEIDVPMEKAAQLPRGTLEVLSQVSRQKRKKYLDIAPDLEVNELREVIAKEDPLEHIERRTGLRFKPTESQRHTVDTALQAVMMLEELPTREEGLEALASDWLTNNQQRLEEYYAEKEMVANV